MIKGCKICGISDPNTLNFLINHPHPPTFIGFICNYPKSSRYVEFENLKKLLRIKFIFKVKSIIKSKTLSKKPKVINPNYFYFYNENGKLVGIPYGN